MLALNENFVTLAVTCIVVRNRELQGHIVFIGAALPIHLLASEVDHP